MAPIVWVRPNRIDYRVRSVALLPAKEVPNGNRARSFWAADPQGRVDAVQSLWVCLLLAVFVELVGVTLPRKAGEESQPRWSALVSPNSLLPQPEKSRT